MASTNIIAQMSVVLGAQTKEFEAGMAKARSELSGFKKAGEQMKGLGENMSKWLSAPLAGLAAISLKTAGDIQALKKGLEAVSGSAEGAEKQFKSLKEVAKLPGLGLEEAIQGSVNLQAAGFSAEQAEGALKGFGNALATVGKGKAELDGVTSALSQMAAKGTISAEEINQIAERVPQIRKVMQQAFGTSNTEELQKMGISASEFVDKVTVELNKLPPVAGGLKNSFENLGDAGKLALANLGDAINKNLNVEGLLNGLAGWVTKLAEGFNQLSPGVQRFIIITAAAAAAIGPLLLAFGALMAAIPSMVAGYAALKIGLLALRGGFVSATKAAISFLAANAPIIATVTGIAVAIAGLVLLSKSIYDAWNVVGVFFSQLWAQIQLSFANALLGIVQTVNKFGAVFGVQFKDAENSLQKFANSAKATLDEKPYVSLGDAVSAVGQKMSDNLQAGMAAVKGFFFSGSEAATTGADKIATATDKVIAKTQALKAAMGGAGKRGGAIQSLDTKGFDTNPLAPLDIPAQLKLLPVTEENFKEVNDSLLGPILAFAQTASAAVNDLLVNSFVSLGDAIGSAISGGNGLDNFFNTILMSIMDFAAMMGKQLIVLGLGKIALDRLFESVGGGPIAIAAGVALIAAAGAVKSSLAHSSKGIGSGGSGSTSSSPNYSGASGGSGYGQNGFTLETKIAGSDLQVILNKTNYRDNRFGR